MLTASFPGSAAPTAGREGGAPLAVCLPFRLSPLNSRGLTAFRGFHAQGTREEVLNKTEKPSGVCSDEALPTAALASIVAEGKTTPEDLPQSMASEVSVDMYESPLCLEIDRLICSCDDAEDILRLLVSHRGALYVHNLVTAIKTLAELTTRRLQQKHSRDSKQKQQQENQQHEEAPQQGPEQQEEGRMMPTSTPSLVGARMEGPQPPTWPRDGQSFKSFLSLLSQTEAQAERRNSQRNTGEDIVRDDRQVNPFIYTPTIYKETPIQMLQTDTAMCILR